MAHFRGDFKAKLKKRRWKMLDDLTCWLSYSNLCKYPFFNGKQHKRKLYHFQAFLLPPFLINIICLWVHNLNLNLLVFQPLLIELTELVQTFGYLHLSKLNFQMQVLCPQGFLVKKWEREQINDLQKTITFVSFKN